PGTAAPRRAQDDELALAVRQLAALQQPAGERAPAPVELRVAHHRAEDVERGVRPEWFEQRSLLVGALGVGHGREPWFWRGHAVILVAPSGSCPGATQLRRATATSISTAPPRGSAATPMAERVWRPADPNTSDSNRLAPSTTAGCAS